jgi:gas vesicle protein
MIKLIVEASTNIYSLIGVAIGSVSGIVIALVNGRGKSIKEIAALKEKLSAAETRADGFAKAFSIVFDAYERDFIDQPDKIKMLRDLKDQYKL